MPRFNHVVETQYRPTFRTEKIVGMFDVPPADVIRKSWDVDLPIEGLDWNIGLIVGASGSGKTTIARRAFQDATFFDGHAWSNGAFVDDFDKSLDVSVITNALSHVGFSSPPSWLLPYHCLSNGQKFRADLARAILETNDILVFDEFTSLVDRTVAQIGSHAVQKFIRAHHRQFVAVTCHYDINEWLEPDWIYDLSSMTLDRRRLRRPPINLQIRQVHHSIWHIFKGHHYLSANLNKAARVLLATINDDPVAMTAALAFPHAILKNVWRGHRTVVLPDYQGVGIGNRLSEAMGDLMLSEGKSFISTTSHPSMINHRLKSPKWEMTRKPSRGTKVKTSHRVKNLANSNAINRLTCSFRYVG